MPALLFEEIKKDQQVQFSESYEVVFWRQKEDGYWKQDWVTYYTKAKDDHLPVKERFEKDYPNCNIVKIVYQ